jgi:16S rRNA (cytidine1402-2'-O)-methyltransferase
VVFGSLSLHCLEQLPLKTAVKLCAEITGQSRNAQYDCAIALKNTA